MARFLMILALAAASLRVGAAPAEPGTPEFIPGSSVAEAMEILRADPRTQAREQGGWIVMERPEAYGGSIWSFTPPGHPAHPALIKRSIIETPAGINLGMVARCEADKPACDRLWAEKDADTHKFGKDGKDARKRRGHPQSFDPAPILT